eukprot:8597054-Pyramimonas_sp.AAC.1
MSGNVGRCCRFSQPKRARKLYESSGDNQGLRFTAGAQLLLEAKGVELVGRPGKLPRVPACVQAHMEAFLSALPLRSRGAPKGSLGKMSRSRDFLCSPGLDAAK